MHVLRGDGLAGAPVGALARLRRLAEDLGARFHTVVGDGRAAPRCWTSPAAPSHPARARHLAALPAGAGVRRGHRRPGRAGLRADRRAHGHPRRGRARAAAAAAARRAVAARRAAGLGAGRRPARPRHGDRPRRRGLIALSTDVVLFFLATVVRALVGGLGPALLAALLGGLLLNFFLTPPLYSLPSPSAENVVALVAMVVVAVLVALVVDRAARRAQQAARARAEAALLASFARTVLTRRRPAARPAGEGPRGLRAARRWRCCERADDGSAGRVRRLRAGPGPTPGGRRRRRRRRPTTCTSSAARPRAGRRRPAAAGAVGGQALLALRSQRVGGRGRRGPPARRRRPRLRTALLSAVGHDLRTPLAVDQGGRRQPARPATCACPTPTASSWPPRSRSPPTGSPRWSTTCSTPPGWPTGAVDARRSAGRRTTRSSPRALAGLPRRRTASRVDVDEDLPDVLADAGLLERVVANLVDNALRHARAARRSRCAASAYGDRVELRVVDRGPGVPRASRDGFSSRSSGSATATARRRGGPGPRRRARVHRGDGRHAHRRGHPRRRADDGRRRCRRPRPCRELAQPDPTLARPRPSRPPMSHVLVVDDDPQILRTLRINLRARGLRRAHAPDGAAALRGRRRPTTPTSSCSTSACPTSTAPR